MTARRSSLLMTSLMILLVYGCSVSRSDTKMRSLGIPTGAVQVDEGTDRLTYTPRRSGTVYVYDVDDDRLVYQGRVRDGDRLTIDPETNRLELNGRQVVDRDLKRKDRHRIYFFSDRQRDTTE